MADIVEREQVRLPLPYVRGTGGPPILVISQLTRTLSYAPAYPPRGAPPSLPSETTLPPQGPILEERKHEDRRVCRWGRVLASQKPGSDISTWVVKG